VAALAPTYRPRRPTETALYGVVRDHLETFLAHTRETYEAPLPRYVEQELRGYLRCGVFAHGFVRALRDEPDAAHDGRDEAPPRNDGAVELDGFNLHASVAIAGDDDLGRERLMRYGTRPPLALDRLRRLPDRRITYRIKKLREGRAKQRVMTPLEFLARLAAIVPPPRYPLLRYAGVLGPRSSWRRDVVPRAPQPRPCGRRPGEKERAAAGTKPEAEARPTAASRAQPTAARIVDAVGASFPVKSTDAEARAPLGPADVVLAGKPSAGGQLLAPNVLSVKHWSRLLGGMLYAASPRVDWASLLRRSFEVDVLACPGCGGRLRVLGEVTDPAMVRLVLDSLGMPTDAPRVARARDPTEWLGEHGVA
jgi:Putative transposase